MSIDALNAVWQHFPRGGSDMLVALALADFCDDKGRSLHPSIRTIARKCRLSECHTRRIVHRLIHEKLLEVIGNEFGGDRGKSRQYRFRFDRLATNGSVTPIADASPRVDATPIAEERYPCRGRSFTPVADTSQTTKEPPLTVNGNGELDEQALTPSTFVIPLNDGSEYCVSAKQIAEWETAYPAVDVKQQLRAMRQWSIANPRKRKTKRGVLAFANRWLAHEQDRPSRGGNGRANDDPFRGGI